MVIEIGDEVRVSDIEPFFFIIFYMPVIVISFATKLQRKLVMIVSLCVEVDFHIFAKHETVVDMSLRHMKRCVIVVISLYLNVTAVRHIVLLFIASVHIVAVVFYGHFLVVDTLFSISLHVFEKIQCRGILAMPVRN